jgi:regulator of cell morphogenesis and NO signaling
MSFSDKTIGEVVAADYRTAAVFKRHKIDFCCGGQRKIVDACQARQVDIEQLESEVNAAKAHATVAAGLNFTAWSPDFLADYIVNQHHSYVRTAIPEISAFAKKVASVHGERHPELVEIDKIWQQLSAELLLHLEKEEKELFPYFKAAEKGKALPLSALEDEHEEAGLAMAQIRELSNDFTLPEDACTTYKVLFRMLEDFETDLHLHVHLENNILFPQA